MSVTRGDIYMVNFGKGFGSIQGGYRPCIIVSNNTGNHFSSIAMVAPITTKTKHPLPTHISVGTETGIKQNSTVLYEQIFVISKSQLVEKVGYKPMTNEDDTAIATALGLFGLGELKLKEK